MIQGFSKLSKAEKISLLKKLEQISESTEQVFQQFEYSPSVQNKLDSLVENTLTNYPLPFSVAPNFLINGKEYTVPMVIEESSVVAAASHAAKFWYSHGGFHCKLIGETRIGQIHFLWKGTFDQLDKLKSEIEKKLLLSVTDLTQRMITRGGGIGKFMLIDFSNQIPDYYQLRIEFFTADAMGANFINSCLERMARELEYFFNSQFENELQQCEIIMAILSNYTPDSAVECWVECPIDSLEPLSEKLGAKKFAEKFKTAVDIAKIDIYRAVTHNKGIYNGIDAVVLATGNDFRAVEACGHAFASAGENYKSLSDCAISNNQFRLSVKIPLAVGTVGGLTRVHPLATAALELLGNPSAAQLMQIAVAAGLANHFSAVRSLITHGIQKGHMKMHLTNILMHLNANELETKLAFEFFQHKEISFRTVEQFLNQIRNNEKQ